MHKIFKNSIRIIVILFLMLFISSPFVQSQKMGIIQSALGIQGGFSFFTFKQISSKRVLYEKKSRYEILDFSDYNANILYRSAYNNRINRFFYGLVLDMQDSDRRIKVICGMYSGLSRKFKIVALNADVEQAIERNKSGNNRDSRGENAIIVAENYDEIESFECEQ